MPMTRRMPLHDPIAEPPRNIQGASAPPLHPNVPAGVNELMISSLPPMVSGADVYLRQFYRGSELPWRRYMPLSGL